VGCQYSGPTVRIRRFTGEAAVDVSLAGELSPIPPTVILLTTKESALTALLFGLVV